MIDEERRILGAVRCGRAQDLSPDCIDKRYVQGRPEYATMR
jgi:hypothetical protein